MTTVVDPYNPIVFTGNIILIERVQDVEFAVQFLLVEELLGFDMEWKPEFKTGQDSPVSLIQLATEDKCFLFRMQKLGFMPPSLRDILTSSTICKVGHTVDRVDNQKLKRQYGITAHNFLDLRQVATKQKRFTQLSLKGLTAHVLGRYLDKHLAISNWSQWQLSLEQMIYAATDAWVTRELYKKITNWHSLQRECLICGKVFQTKNGLIQHKYDKGHIYNSNVDDSFPVVSPPPLPQLITINEQKHEDSLSGSAEQNGTQNNIILHNNLSLNTAAVGTPTSKCIVCGRQFRTPNALETHKRAKHRDLVNNNIEEQQPTNSCLQNYHQLTPLYGLNNFDPIPIQTGCGLSPMIFYWGGQILKFA